MNTRKVTVRELDTVPDESTRANKPTAVSGSLENDVPAVLRSEELLQGRREAFIVHGEEIYRLIRTRNNKLILQK